MRKAIILTILFFSARCLVSCCREAGYTFRWAGMHLTNIHQPPLPSGAQEYLSADSARISAYAFRLSLEHERVAKQDFSELGFSTSYAFKCVALFQPVDSVVSLDIITRNALDAAHPAGSNINDVVQGRSSYTAYSSLSTAPWLPLTLVQLQLSQKQNSTIDGAFDLRINNVTPFTGQHRFIVKMVMKTGAVMTDSTSMRFY